MLNHSENFIKCNHCNQLVLPDAIKTTDDDVDLCPQCYQSETVMCDLCGHKIYVHDGVTSAESEIICEQCADDCYTCEHCGKPITSDYDYECDADGYAYCRTCADDYLVACECCGELFPENTKDVSIDNITVCYDCYRREYTECEQCGALVHVNDVYYTDDFDNLTFCEDCYYQYLSDRGPIEEYHHTYARQFYKTESDLENEQLFFGVELEVEVNSNRGSCAQSLRDLDPNEMMFDLKEDGSLCHGFEITTQPATLDYHLHSDLWTNILSELDNYEVTSHDNGRCGLHIHVSRRALDGPEHVAKMMLLISKFWHSHILEFSRRHTDGHYYAKPKSTDSNDHAKLANADISVVSDIIYKNNTRGAINNGNDATVEFRFFRGTLNLNSLKAALQFIHNLVKFSADADLFNLDNCTWNDIIHYQEFDELTAYDNKLASKYTPDAIELISKEAA